MRHKILIALLVSFFFTTCLAQKEAYRRTGFYVGANAGADFAKYDFDRDLQFNEQISQPTNVKGTGGVIVIVPGTTRNMPRQTTSNYTIFTGGIQIGYGKLFRQQWLIGIEGNI